MGQEEIAKILTTTQEKEKEAEQSRSGIAANDIEYQSADEMANHVR